MSSRGSKHHVSTVFSQIMQFLPKSKFDQFVGQHNGDRYTKKLSSWNQLQILLFSQATGKESLRDIETGLSLHENKWYHLGIQTVARSTLSDANNNRSYEIYEKLFYTLLSEIQCIVGLSWDPNRKFSFENPLYSLDATVINLCLSVFPWAKYRTAKWACKVHVLLNNRSNIPEVISMTEWKVHEVTEAQKRECFGLASGSILTFDRGYIDYDWFHTLDEKGIFFVTRTKKNTNVFVTKNRELMRESQRLWVRKDELVAFSSDPQMNEFWHDLRVVTFFDEEKKKEYEFITNNLEMFPETIAEIYKHRWQIELFFKWIKQHLKVKSFLGTSKNAVMTQIWIAMIYYLILSYIKYTNKIDSSLLVLSRIICEVFMDRVHLLHILHIPEKNTVQLGKILDPPQLSLL